VQVIAEQQLLRDDLHARLHALLHERRQAVRCSDMSRHCLDPPGGLRRRAGKDADSGE